MGLRRFPAVKIVPFCPMSSLLVWQTTSKFIEKLKGFDILENPLEVEKMHIVYLLQFAKSDVITHVKRRKDNEYP